MKKLTRKQAISTLFMGLAGTAIGQEKLRFGMDMKLEPIWLVVSNSGCRGVRFEREGKVKEITFDEIWEALS